MFEVNVFTPSQFGAFIPWLVVNRGPLSALVHPNTVDPVSGEHEEAERDHTQRAIWMGEKVPLDLSSFKSMGEKKNKEVDVPVGVEKMKYHSQSLAIALYNPPSIARN